MDKPLIVCVDDDDAILAVVVRILSRGGNFEVRQTMEPRRALEWIRNEQVAVLVSDYEMPEMTGAQLAGKAKLLRPETVRILLTGKRTLETAVDGINQGEIFKFIGKPFEDKQLRDAVNDAVRRHEELKLLTVDRQRQERREAIRNGLEAEYPGISNVNRDGNTVVVTADPWGEAQALGLDVLRRALEPK